NLVFLLLIVGLVGLYIELSHPGLIWPGVIGGICLITALTALQTLPIHYAALGLLLLGVVLLIAEAFLTTLGLLAVAGLACVFLGSWFLLDEARTDLQIDRTLIVTLVVALGLLALWVARVLLNSVRAPAHSVQANLVGQRGAVRETIDPQHPGRVQVLGESWRARAGESLAVGAPVLVTAVDGLTLTVRAEPGPAQPAAVAGGAESVAPQPQSKP
ncbi:MAG TPA: NfeD family protein, partial [bacterium]|nr:NfeD family protein [bacterium]